ncbi:hypothetical protein [uncultured Jatrophihabitans sp.]|uniref:hypothetical protein n=1 Tax=uncultured Jatrophihabitans sp. TaxID=1610747 RepID=UPI0035CC20E9
MKIPDRDAPDEDLANDWADIYGGVLSRFGKPIALTSMAQPLNEIFPLLKEVYGTGNTLTLALDTIDSVTESSLSQKSEVAGISLRKIQLLYLIAATKAETTTDIVVGLCVELVRAMGQLEPAALAARGNYPSVGATERAFVDQMRQFVNGLKHCGRAVARLADGDGEIAILF